MKLLNECSIEDNYANFKNKKNYVIFLFDTSSDGKNMEEIKD